MEKIKQHIGRNIPALLLFHPAADFAEKIPVPVFKFVRQRLAHLNTIINKKEIDPIWFKNNLK
ncbi:hypothetical protein LIT38_08350 [Bacillus sp. CMF12]|uniref:hypothetical protein n=1 Tax=Bacillus sp. CMF12 TaxID=2884834 RepID=UPI002079E0D4|nr:hypothetical protein [Bacillus sp. CMF12]USK51434.1 hypothetical protein LIT38_08350 [Bacillus sp. CMF12]